MKRHKVHRSTNTTSNGRQMSELSERRKELRLQLRHSFENHDEQNLRVLMDDLEKFVEVKVEEKLEKIGFRRKDHGEQRD